MTNQNNSTEPSTESVAATDSDYTPGLSVRDLPDCLLLVPEIGKRGGLHYIRVSERNVATDDNSAKLEMETVKIVDDVDEHSEATGLVTRWKYALGKLGRHTPGGIVVRKDRLAEVTELCDAGRDAFAEFNARAKTCKVSFYAWVFEVNGSNAANLQSLIDDIGEKLSELESAMVSMDPKGMRDVLKKSKGFAELLPAEVAERLAAARESAQAKAEELSRAEKKIGRLDKKLQDELGTTDPEAYTAAIDEMLAGPLSGELASRATRIAKLVEDKESTIVDLEQAKRTIDTSAIRLARFSVLGSPAQDASDASDAAGAARAAARFGALVPGAEGPGAKAETESEDSDAKADAPSEPETSDAPSEDKGNGSMLSKGAAARFGGLSL
jgi:HPt (histidine-containing phosphotransfer) domain-containing protein